VSGPIESTEEMREKEQPEDGAAFMRRWAKEIAIADAAERKWRERSRMIYQLYEGGEKESQHDIPSGEQSFNILWSNTETLLPAVYNSAPQPDVRRRFRDDDPVGKAASTVLERAISYAIDTEEFYDTLEDSVLDMLLPGRGLARVKYEPVFIPQMMPSVDGAEPQPRMDAMGQPMQEKADEKTFIEHVQWDDFLRGPGKRWSHVPWIGFRHRLKKDQLVRMFGEEMAKNVPLNFPDGMENKQDHEKMAFATAEVIEVWDKETMTVFFVSMGYKDGPLRLDEDPMELKGFWPVPKPLMAIKNTRTLVPKPMYQMYEAKAVELERISRRINGAVRVCKLRGIYDSTMTEVQKLLEADDTDMIAIENAARYYGQQGGIEKAIWMMPVNAIAAVLTTLYNAQNECKQTIYEITGISDVVRGATNPNETATAQRYKAQFGGIRLKTMQREVKRFGRDLIRLLADVICSKYDQETLASITGLQYPTGEQKAQAQQQLQMAQQQPPQMDPATGQPMPAPPPDPQLQKTANSVSWDEIMQVLRSDAQRCYKVDVETDSTIAETLETDMEGLQQVLTALQSVITGMLPLVQQGIMTMDALKSVCLSIVRRARLGSAVEDAVETMQAPAPPQPQAPPPDPMVGVQDAVKQIMEAMKKPKRLAAQVGMDGRVEGEVVDA
jgi:hypothetical protein